MQPPAARHSVGGGRRAVAARIESAGERSRARSGWTAAEAASSAALRSYREARLWGGGGRRRVAVVGAVMALRLPGRPDETRAPAEAARSSRPSGQRRLGDGRGARFRRWCRLRRRQGPGGCLTPGRGRPGPRRWPSCPGRRGGGHRDGGRCGRGRAAEHAGLAVRPNNEETRSTVGHHAELGGGSSQRARRLVGRELGAQLLHVLSQTGVGRRDVVTAQLGRGRRGVQHDKNAQTTGEQPTDEHDDGARRGPARPAGRAATARWAAADSVGFVQLIETGSTRANRVTRLLESVRPPAAALTPNED